MDPASIVTTPYYKMSSLVDDYVAWNPMLVIQTLRKLLDSGGSKGIMD